MFMSITKSAALESIRVWRISPRRSGQPHAPHGSRSLDHAPVDVTPVGRLHPVNCGYRQQADRCQHRVTDSHCWFLLAYQALREALVPE